jgi:hypothetical protein
MPLAFVSRLEASMVHPRTDFHDELGGRNAKIIRFGG